MNATRMLQKGFSGQMPLCARAEAKGIGVAVFDLPGCVKA
jgi:hypothetical protein